MLLLVSQVTKLVHIIFVISKEAVHMVAVLGDTTLAERGYILQINLVELSMEWVPASSIAEGSLVTIQDVLLKSSDVVIY